jgi:hypothetical protein
MKHAARSFLTALAAAMISAWALPAAAAPLPAAWVRTWFADPGDRGMVRLTVERTPDGVLVAVAWGACHPNVCLWGSVPLKYSPDGVHAAAVWTSPYSIEHVAFHLSRDGQTLTAVERAHFTDHSGRPDYVVTVPLH